jgi:hypothetical protein
MVKRARSVLFAVGVLAAAVQGPAQPASMALRLGNAELVARSHLVVYGRVTEVRPGGTTSEAVVAVECPLKGKPGEQVTVAFSQGASESPVFEPGEVVLLFLTEAGSGRYQTTGGEQGKFSLGRGGPAR